MSKASAATAVFPVASTLLTPPPHNLPVSSAGILQLLAAEQPLAIRVNALGRLLPLVDFFWHEMASHQHLIKALLGEAEGPTAALLLSKVESHPAQTILF